MYSVFTEKRRAGLFLPEQASLKTAGLFVRRIILLFIPLSLFACAARTEPARLAEAAPPQPPAVAAPDVMHCTGAEDGFRRVLAAYRAGDSATAFALARSVVEEFPNTPWYKRSLFLMERALIRLDRPSEADAAMLRVLAEYPELGDYALFILAEYRFSLKEYTGAAALYQQLVERYEESSLTVLSAYRRARALVECYAYSPAAEAFEQFLRDYPRSEFAPDAGLGLGRALLCEAELERAVRAYLDILVKYPGNSSDQEVEKALAEMRGGGVEVPELLPAELYERGRNLYRTAQHEKAVETFTRLLATDPGNAHSPDILLKTGISLYTIGRRAEAVVALERMIKDYSGDERTSEALNWLGKSYSKLGDREKSIKTFQRLISSFPSCEWADDALFYIGNVYREANDLKKALAYYGRIVTEYPDSKFADSALWWQAWSYYTGGDFRDTERMLQELVTRYPRSFLVNQARYWQGRAAERTGDPARAGRYYGKVLRKGPYSYYGYRAAERMAALGLPEADLNEENSTETAAVCADGRCPGDPQDVYEADDGPPVWTEEAKRILSTEPWFNKTLELMQLDMKKEAATELWDLQEKAPRKRGALIALSKAFFELGDYHRSLLLVLRNYDRYLDGNVRETPGDFWLLAYPQGYWESIMLYSRRYGLDPYFIAAIIREESQFRAEALSPAGARGVMQVMPATGEWIAQIIRTPGFDRGKLFDSDTAINLGAWYVGHLMKRFNNDPLLTAAAYNAGPEAVSAWLLKNGAATEKDEFVEFIPFSETRGYVKKVLRNYAEYKRIYARSGRSSSAVSSRSGATVDSLNKDPGATTP